MGSVAIELTRRVAAKEHGLHAVHVTALPTFERCAALSKTFQIAVSILLLAVLLTFIGDSRETWRVLQLIDFRWALLGLSILTFDRLLMSWKWLLLLAQRGYRFSILDATRLYCTAMMWGLALPSTVGADAIRTLLLRRRAVQMSDAVSSILVERGIGFIAALVLALISLGALQWLWPQAASYRYLFVLTGGLLAAAGLLLMFSFSARAFEILQSLLPARLRQTAVMRKLEHLHEAYRSLGTRPSLLVVFASLTLAEQLLAVPFTWAVGHALGLELSFLALLAALPLALLLARLPVSFDGLGIFETIFIAVMSHAGIRPSHSLAIAIASRLLQLMALLPWWLAYQLKSETRAAERTRSLPALKD